MIQRLSFRLQAIQLMDLVCAPLGEVRS